MSEQNSPTDREAALASLLNRAADALGEMHRLGLVIESAVRRADSANRPVVASMLRSSNEVRLDIIKILAAYNLSKSFNLEDVPDDVWGNSGSSTGGLSTDGADTETVLTAVLYCANSWFREARIIGNVRAGDLGRAIREALSALPHNKEGH